MEDRADLSLEEAANLKLANQAQHIEKLEAQLNALQNNSQTNNNDNDYNNNTNTDTTTDDNNTGPCVVPFLHINAQDKQEDNNNTTQGDGV